MQCFSAEGRRSLDAGLTANETIDSKQRSYRVGLVCGLFIEKTYDYISYRFLLSVMEKNGFGPSRIRCIYYCISTMRLPVNDTPI